MEYKIKTISSKEEIVNCNRFEIDHVQWNHAITPPKACGYMGYLKGEGLYVQICTAKTVQWKCFWHSQKKERNLPTMICI